MRNFFLFVITLIIIFMLCASSCRKEGKCEEPLDINQSILGLIFKQASGSYLYAEVNPVYNKDSLKIFDELGNKYSVYAGPKTIPNTSSGYWYFDFGPMFNPQTDSESYNREICKNFIIHYNYIETDTIKTCYKAYKTECGSIFNSLKIFHKGVLLIEKDNTITATITITKN